LAAAVPSTELSVVVPTAGRADRLPPLVRRLLAEAGVAEVVVVADGPDAVLRALLEPVVADDERLRLLELPTNVGAALARRAGIEVARQDLVLLLDDDVTPVPGLVAAHLQAHRRLEQRTGDPRTLVVGAMPVDLSGVTGRGHLATRLYAAEYARAAQVWSGQPSSILRGLWLGNVSARRADLLAAEDVRPTAPLSYHEDLDLGLRLAHVGVQAVYCPDAAAVHRHQRSGSAFAADAYRRGESIRLLERRWGRVPEGPRAEVELTGAGLAQRLLFRLGARPGPARAAVALLLGASSVVDTPRLRPLGLAALKAVRVVQTSRGYRDAAQGAQ
jgi:GT2 family glycosyltransferase